MSSKYPSFGGAPSRPCMRCGTPLTINETQCSRCGMFNPLPQGQQFGGLQQGAQGGPSGPLWGGQAQQASQYQQAGNGAWSGNQDASASAWGSRGQAGGGWQQNNLFGNQDPTPPPQSLQNNAFGTGFGQSSLSNFQKNPNQSALNNAFGNSNFQQSAERPSLNSFMQATRQNNGLGGSSLMTPNRPAWARKPGDDDDDDYGRGKGKNRASAGVVIVIIVLLIVLLGGGGYGGYYFYKHRNDGATSPTTTTTGPAISTPTGTPLFSDTFKNNANKWDTNPPAGAKVKLNGDGQLLLESDNNKLFPEFVPGGKVYDDLELDVDVGLTGGDPNNGYGVYIRTASTQNSVLGLYYRFEVYGNGVFYIYKGSVDNGTPQANSLKNSLQPSNAIALTGKLNHLTIIAKGQTLTFKVNGTTLSTFTDPSYKSGNIALFVSQVKDATSSAQAVFKNLAIFPAP